MRLIWPKVLLPPPSTMYVATVHGLPAKPISGTRPRQFAAHQRDGVDHVLATRAPGRARRAWSMSAGGAHRVLELRAFAGLEFQP